MRKAEKVWLISAAALVVLGLFLFGAMMMLSGDAQIWEQSAVQMETRTYEIEESFSGISMQADTADIAFALSEGGKCLVVCEEYEGETYAVTVRDDTLHIQRREDAKQYRLFSVYTDSPKITLYLPETEYVSLSVRNSTGDMHIPAAFSFDTAEILTSTGDVEFFASAEKISITAGTGDIRVEEITAETVFLSVSTGQITLAGAECTGDVTVKVSTGKAELTGVRCGGLYSDGDTGDLTMTDVVAEGNMILERTTGDIRFDGCDAADITVTTDTGDVSGSLLSDKVFFTQTDTGDVDLPDAVSGEGGICSITTDTGDMDIRIS